MHYFLTGERGTGKSWVVQQTAALTGLPCFGFLTRFSDIDNALHMMAPSDFWFGEGAHRDDNRIAERREGRMVLMPEVFDALGKALLREARAHPEGIILMDECGHLEKNQLFFHREIAHCLDQNIPVLGVLRVNQPWHSFIIHHPKVRVVTVTAENRDSLPGRISEALRSGER